jgi:hypothetical protein
VTRALINQHKKRIARGEVILNWAW